VESNARGAERRKTRVDFELAFKAGTEHRLESKALSVSLQRIAEDGECSALCRAIFGYLLSLKWAHVGPKITDELERGRNEDRGQKNSQ